MQYFQSRWVAKGKYFKVVEELKGTRHGFESGSYSLAVNCDRMKEKYLA